MRRTTIDHTPKSSAKGNEDDRDIDANGSSR